MSSEIRSLYDMMFLGILKVYIRQTYFENQGNKILLNTVMNFIYNLWHIKWLTKTTEDTSDGAVDERPRYYHSSSYICRNSNKTIIMHQNTDYLVR